MTRLIPLFLTVATIIGASPVFAQDRTNAPGKVVVTVIPAGATFFTEAKDDPNGPSFGQYQLGGAVAVNLNRYVGIEGEVGGGVGISQDLKFGNGTVEDKSPNQLNYNANLVLSAPNKTSVVPYITGGVGGLTLFERPTLAINDVDTFLTGNVGGGVTWYAGPWGLRADYRFIAVQSKDDAPSFFGRDERYGHRVYAGVLLNFGR